MRVSCLPSEPLSPLNKLFVVVCQAVRAFPQTGQALGISPRQFAKDFHFGYAVAGQQIFIGEALRDKIS